MSITPDEILGKISAAAEGAFKEGWDAVKKYAPAEFKKMSVQLSDIVENVALYKVDKQQGYSLQTAKILFRMQLTACESVLVAVSNLTLIAVQNALNAIMTVLKNTFSGIIASIV